MKLPVKHFLVIRLLSVAEEFIRLLDSPFLLQLWVFHDSQVLNRQSRRTKSLIFFFLKEVCINYRNTSII